MKQTLIVFTCLTSIFTLTGCGIGMLLFYREAKTADIYRNNNSKKTYYTVKATTLAHCGCTYLSIDNYVNKKKTFNIYYNYNNETGKTIYKTNKTTQKQDTIRLIPTTSNNFSIPFDSLDIEIFKRIDTIAIQKPKEIVYEIKRQGYKGYKRIPNYFE